LATHPSLALWLLFSFLGGGGRRSGGGWGEEVAAGGGGGGFSGVVADPVEAEQADHGDDSPETTSCYR